MLTRVKNGSSFRNAILKSSSFPQGHEETVRHLVEAVQETRKKEAELLQKAKSKQQKQGSGGGQGQGLE